MDVLFSFLPFLIILERRIKNHIASADPNCCDKGRWEETLRSTHDLKL